MKRVFLDSNVLCYGYDYRVPVKRARAKAIIESFALSTHLPIISSQVMQEFYNTLTKKFGLEPSLAKRELLVIGMMQTVYISSAQIYSAADLHAAATISFWDALIIAAAQSADCDELWSEDLQTGRSFGKLKIVNPFETPAV